MTDTENETNLIVIGKYERLKKKKKKEKRNWPGTVYLPERLIVHISTT